MLRLPLPMQPFLRLWPQPRRYRAVPWLGKPHYPSDAAGVPPRTVGGWPESSSQTLAATAPPARRTLYRGEEARPWHMQSASLVRHSARGRCDEFELSLGHCSKFVGDVCELVGRHVSNRGGGATFPCAAARNVAVGAGVRARAPVAASPGSPSVSQYVD